MKAFLCLTEQTAPKMCLQQVAVVFFVVYCQDVAPAGKVCKVLRREEGEKGAMAKQDKVIYTSSILGFAFHHSYKVHVTKLRELCLG